MFNTIKRSYFCRNIGVFFGLEYSWSYFLKYSILPEHSSVTKTGTNSLKLKK